MICDTRKNYLNKYFNLITIIKMTKKVKNAKKKGQILLKRPNMMKK